MSQGDTLTLSGLLRDAARQIEEAIRANEQELRALADRRRSIDSDIEAARGQVSRARGVIEERRHTYEETDARVREIERQQKDLERKLAERRSERDNSLESLHSAQSAGAEQKKQLQTVEEEALRIKAQIESISAERSGHQRRLLESRRQAFGEYHDALWKRLLDLSNSQGERARQLAVYADFEAARMRDAEVANLDQARLEWSRIAANATVPSVKAAAKAEALRVEEELSRRFPGVLEIERSRGVTSEIEELYFSPSERGGTHEVFLPIPESVYVSLGEGKSGREEDLAMRLAWSVIQALRPSPKGAEFVFRSGLCVLRMGPEPLEVGEAVATIGNPTDGGGACIFSPVPDIVREALVDEN